MLPIDKAGRALSVDNIGNDFVLWTDEGENKILRQFVCRNSDEERIAV